MNVEQLQHNPFFLNTEAVEWVKTTLNNLSVREKIGQIFLPLCQNDSPESLERLLHYQPGGICRMPGTPAPKLRESARFLQERSPIPLLMSGDIEFSEGGGIGGGTVFPNQLGVAATGDPAIAARMGQVAAREGGYCGFNWSFSPVVDVDLNFRSPIVNTRSFGNDPERVLACALEYVRAMQHGGMAACIKHWPGDGCDDRDQHLVTSCNSLDMTTWHSIFGRIYRTLIESGVKTVMSAHITLPAYYRETYPDIGVAGILPASFSKELNIELLRNELGFNGLIVSDATPMAGFTSQGPRAEILPMTIENGCDMFLFALDADLDLALLQRGLDSGQLSESRLNEAVMRVLALKASLGLHTTQRQGSFLPDETDRHQYLRTVEHVQWEAECAERSITLVKDTQRLIPLSPVKHKRLLLIQSDRKEGLTPRSPFKMQDFLEDDGFEVTLYQKSAIVDPDLYDVVMYIVEEQASLCKGSLRIKWGELHHGLLQSMTRYWHVIPTVFISFGNPYHLYEVPRCKTYINAYTPIEPVQKALVAMLTGKLPFRGISPVDPFCGLEETRL